MLAALLSVLPPALQADAADVQAGAEIFEQRCAGLCHQAPAARQLKPQQWRIVLNTMQTRMEHAGMTPLSEQELEQVFRYLTASR